MSDAQKKFLYDLAVVVIAAALSFLLSYVEALRNPIESGAVGGVVGTIGVWSKRVFFV